MEELLRLIWETFKGLKYVVIGAIPVAIWGRPRTTLDVDIVLTTQESEFASIVNKLKERGFKVNRSTERRLLRGLAVKLSYTKNLSVDLRMASYSLDFQAIERAVPKKIFGLTLPIASKEDVIAYKIARYDYQDRADIQTVLLLQKKLNINYIVSSVELLAQEVNSRQISGNLAEFLKEVKEKPHA